GAALDRMRGTRVEGAIPGEGGGADVGEAERRVLQIDADDLLQKGVAVIVAEGAEVCDGFWVDFGRQAGGHRKACRRRPLHAVGAMAEPGVAPTRRSTAELERGVGLVLVDGR